MKRHLEDLAEWTPPDAGMFFWFKLLLASPSEADDAPRSEGCSQSLIRDKALSRGVLALPGTIFYPKGRTSTFVRASFSTLEEEDVNEALRRLRDVILETKEGSA